MTEEEAKTKWCPFARHKDGNRIPYGDGTSGSTDTEDWKLFGGEMADMHPCIGSACMAWRPEYRVQTIGDKTTSVLIGGFCGLAGKT